MKKRGLIVFAFLLVVINCLILVYAQDIGVDTAGLGSDAERIRNVTEKIQRYTDREKWEFLADQWKEFLVKNTAFASVDKFLNKISILFFIFAGISYEFSPLFIMVLFLWLVHLWILSDYIFLYMPLKRGVGILVCIGILIVLSQLKYMIFVSEIALNIVLWGEEYWRILSTLLFLLIVLLIVAFFKYGRKILKKNREEMEKMLEQQQRKAQGEIFHTLSKGIGGH